MFKKTAHTHRGVTRPEMDFSTQIQKNSDSAHPDLSKTVPTAPLAPLAAELRDPEVWAFFAKIAIFATESDVAQNRVPKR